MRGEMIPHEKYMVNQEGLRGREDIPDLILEPVTMDFPPFPNFSQISLLMI
jgi:hypothetical protein